MTPRKVLFWAHLCIGVTAGLVILTMSVTGVMLAFERPIVTWADRGYHINPPNDARRLAIDHLSANVQAAQGFAPTGIILRADTALPIEFSFGRERTVLINPYTGEVLTDRSRIRAFFGTVENLHRWLVLPEEKRELGEGITGACTLAFLGLVLSGPLLWLPKEWSWTNVRKILLFRRGGNFRATIWNWHHVLGFWCVVPLFLIVITGVVMAYPWANDLLYRMTGNVPPPTPQRPASGQRPAGTVHQPETQRARQTLDDLFASAEKHVLGWKSITLRLAGPPRAPVTFFIDTGSGRPDLRSQLTLDSETGEVIRWERFETYNQGRRLRTWGRFLHTGEAGGIPGEAIAAMAAASASMLVFTGLCLAVRRFYFWRCRSSK